MKIIRYQISHNEKRAAEDNLELHSVVNTVTIPWSEENEKYAQENAVEGELVIEDVEAVPTGLSVQERLAILEKTIAVADYKPGTWYYRGDKVLFDGIVYSCIAPEGAVCVWSPAEHAAYWQE